MTDPADLVPPQPDPTGQTAPETASRADAGLDPLPRPAAATPDPPTASGPPASPGPLTTQPITATRNGTSRPSRPALTALAKV